MLLLHILLLTSDHDIRYATELLDRDRQIKATTEAGTKIQEAINDMHSSMTAGFNAVYDAIDDGNEILDDFYFREKLIETFVNKIEVFNDKITVSYNVQDGYSVDYSTICFSSNLAGAQRLELWTRGFGDHCSTN